MDVISYTLSKKYTDEKCKEIENDLTNHLNSTMPHQIQDIDNDKSYRYGLKQENGHVILIYKEVE